MHNKKIKKITIIKILSFIFSAQLIFLLLIDVFKGSFFNTQDNDLDNGITITELISNYGISSLRAEGYNGDDITVAIIDTGINPNKDLKNNIIYFHDFINGKNKPYDDNGHGTEVCGVIAGNGVGNSKYIGVAPKTSLIVLKSLDKYGRVDTYKLLESINWIIENKDKYKIDIVCMAYGYTSLGEYEEDPLYYPICDLIDKGVIIVASAGNNELTSPGNIPSVITVGSLDTSLVRQASFSNTKIYGGQFEKPNIYLPGIKIITTSLNGYTVVSGTSFSAAIACGIVSLIKQKYPSYDKQEIEDLLESNTLINRLENVSRSDYENER